jgi:purine nucleosidase
VLALVFARGHPGLSLRGITTVAGNVALADTTANALAVRDYLGTPEVPVVAGSARPLLRPLITARSVHGATGLGAAGIPASASGPAAGHAADYLAAEPAARPGQITLIATGPLTNVALAVARHPPLVSEVAGLVIMGGSAGRGNVTPAAEFNIAVDPEAAAVVFGAGWTVAMVGLDVTLQARATQQVRDRMAGLGRLAGELLLPLLSGYRDQAPQALSPGVPRPAGPPVHDVCAVAAVAAPDLFAWLPARVEVETAGRWTTGMTVTDFSAAPADCNARVAVAIDAAGFWDVVLDAYARAAASLPGSRVTRP